MKQFYSKTLLCLAALVMSVNVFAQTFTQDGVTYKGDSSKGTAEVTAVDRTLGGVTVPATVSYDGTTYSVTSIGANAFYSCTSLTSVSLPNSLTSIGRNAFQDCRALESISLPDNVTVTGAGVFSNCTSLKSVKLPSKLSYINNGVFGSCSSLTTITIPEGVGSIGSQAFYLCSALQSIVVPASVGSIGYEAFINCYSLESVEIKGEKVTDIQKKTFYGDQSLKTVILPTSVKSIAEYAFDGCTALESVEGTDNVTSMKYFAFRNCKSLKTANFPKLKVFNTSVFYGCSMLTTVDMSSAVNIYSAAFGSCSSLSSITIPSTVTAISGDAFDGCYMTADNIHNLSKCDLKITVADVEQEDGLVIKDNKVVLCRRWATSVKMPDTVTRIESFAISECPKLTSIIFSNSLTRISMNEITDCESLQSVDIPASVPSIDNAFRNCPALKDVTLHEGLQTIISSFNTCTMMEELTIPSTVTRISSAFKGFKNLKKLVLLSKGSLPEVDYSFNDKNYSGATLWVDESLTETCRTTTPWSTFGTIKELPSHRSFTITAAGMASSCADRDITLAGREDIKAYIASGFNPATGKVLLTRVWDIPAGTGFILRAAEGTYEVPTTNTSYVYANLLVGTQAETEVPETDGTYNNYILGNGDNGVGFYPSAGGKIQANKSYLHIPATAAVSLKCVRLSFDDEDGSTTGFISVRTLTDRMYGKSPVYNLAGQRKQGLSKGMNIVGGKKIWMK